MSRIFIDRHNAYLNIEIVNYPPEKYRRLDKLITDNVEYKGPKLYYKIESMIVL